jgi:hypothetical protein
MGVLGALLALCCGLGGVAGAAGGGVAVSTDQVQVSPSAGGGWDTSVEVVNSTTDPVSVRVRVDANCHVDVDPHAVPANTSMGVDVTLSGCQLSDGDALRLTVTAGGVRAAVDAVVKGNQPTSPDWAPIGWALLVGLYLGVVAMLAAALLRSEHGGKADLGYLGAPVPGLDASFSFDDSWATTATSVATLLTGLFASSDILNGILSSVPGDRITVMLVAGAVAAGLAGAGLLITKAATDEHGDPFAWGLLLAGVLTLTGLFAQIGVVSFEASRMGLGWISTSAIAVGIAAAALAWMYGVQGMWRTLLPPDPTPDIPSDQLLDAAVTALSTGTPPANDAVFSARVVELARSIEQAGSLSDAQLKDLMSEATDATGRVDTALLRTRLQAASPGPRRPRRKRSAAL